jgi:hypothetical protein
MRYAAFDKMRLVPLVGVCVLQPCGNIVHARRNKTRRKRNWYLQATNRKDRDQRDLLSSREVQTSNHWHRHDDQRIISYDVDSSVRTTRTVSTRQSSSHCYSQPHCKLVDAFATRCVQYPEIMDRYAREDATKDCPAGVGDDDSQEDPACDLESLRGEDATILQED